MSVTGLVALNRSIVLLVMVPPLGWGLHVV
jgi:hypothetical protein